MVRDTATGQFAAHAVGMALNPITAAPNVLIGAGQLYQGHKALQGIKALSASVATLQATTAVIGVGTVAVAALSAVSLWQTLKLRKGVQQMRVEVREGFIDIKQILADQEAELIKQIQKASEDIEFQAHRTILARAYGLFDKAMNRLYSAVTMQDMNRRNSEIDAVRTMLFQALSDYDNSQIMSGISSAAYIRRRECVWAIEQAIVMTCEMQGEWQTASDRLSALKTTICQDASDTLDKSKTIDELDFLFPELMRIRDHDLVAIQAWRDRIEWYAELSEEEIHQLKTVFSNESTEAKDATDTEDNLEDKPPEYLFYEEAKSNFIPQALYDSLVFSFDTEARQEREAYICQRATSGSLRAFNPQNLQKASPLSVANLALYFEARDDSLAEKPAVATPA